MRFHGIEWGKRGIMMKGKKNKEHLPLRGFTLVEVLITVAILAVIMGVIGTLFISGVKSYGVSQNNSGLQNDTRLSMEIIQNELRYAKKFILVTADEATKPELQEVGYSYIYLHGGKITIRRYLGTPGQYKDMVLPGGYATDERVFSMKDSDPDEENVIIGIRLDGVLKETRYSLHTDMKLVNIDRLAAGDSGASPGETGLAVKYLK